MSAKYDRDRIGRRLCRIELARMFRVIHKQHRDTPLGVVPAPSRFSDPAGNYAVLYGAETVRCSFWEALARNRFTRRKHRELPKADVLARLVVAFHSTKALVLVDLRGDGPIRIGAPTAVAHDSNHTAGRTLSAAIYADLPNADGLLFRSRFTDHLCVALFDRALKKLAVQQVAPLIEHADFLDALDEYDVVLTGPPE